MNNDARKRVTAAIGALALYSACGSSDMPVEHTAFADVPKLDYAQPSSVDDAGDYIIPARPKRAKASRSGSTRQRSSSAPTGSCTLDDIRQRESGGRYDAVSSTGKYRGAYQFDASTWRSVGGSGDPAAASPEEQDARAAELMRQRGTQPWSVCR